MWHATERIFEHPRFRPEAVSLEVRNIFIRYYLSERKSQGTENDGPVTVLVRRLKKNLGLWWAGAIIPLSS